MNVTVTLSVRPYTDEPHTPTNSPWSVLEAHTVDAESAADTVADLAATLAGDARIGDAVALVTVTDAEKRLVMLSRAWLVEGGAIRELYPWLGGHDVGITMETDTRAARPAPHLLWSIGEHFTSSMVLSILDRFADDIEHDVRTSTSAELRAEGRALFGDLWRARVMLRGRLDNLVCLGGGARMQSVDGVPVVRDTTAPGGPVDVLARLVHARMRACGCLPRPAGVENTDACSCDMPMPEVLTGVAGERDMRGNAAVLAGGIDPVQSVATTATWKALEDNASRKTTNLAVAALSRARMVARTVPSTLIVRILAFRYSVAAHAAGAQ